MSNSAVCSICPLFFLTTPQRSQVFHPIFLYVACLFRTDCHRFAHHPGGHTSAAAPGPPSSTARRCQSCRLMSSRSLTSPCRDPSHPDSVRSRSPVCAFGLSALFGRCSGWPAGLSVVLAGPVLSRGLPILSSLSSRPSPALTACWEGVSLSCCL